MTRTRPIGVSEPYTHARHAKRCRDAAERELVLVQFVQAKLGRTVHCARLAGAWDTPDGLAMWRLELLQPHKGIASCPAHQVRQCSEVDGFCPCAGERGFAALADPAFSQAGVVAPPESLTHETSAASGA